MNIEHWIWPHWQRRGWLARTLWPLAQIYSVLARYNRYRKRRESTQCLQPEAIVIVIGNWTVGGSGKTPMAAWIAKALAAEGWSVGMVTRGYGREDKTFHGWVHPNDDSRRVGDEPLLLARQTGLPVIVDADRVRGAQELVARGCQIIIADDGLQHHRLRADLRLLMIDGRFRLGNGWCLPAGPLREPLEKEPAVDCVLCLEGEPKPGEVRVKLRAGAAVFPVRDWAQNAEAAPVESGNCPASEGTSRRDAGEYLADGRSLHKLAQWHGQPIHAVAGIARPERFFSDLEREGLHIIRHPFPDHHRFCKQDIAFADHLPILMTEKDAVKCHQFADERCWYRALAVSPEASFLPRLQEKIAEIMNRKNLGVKDHG